MFSFFSFSHSPTKINYTISTFAHTIPFLCYIFLIIITLNAISPLTRLYWLIPFLRILSNFRTVLLFLLCWFSLFLHQYFVFVCFFCLSSPSVYKLLRTKICIHLVLTQYLLYSKYLTIICWINQWMAKWPEDNYKGP